jgi:CHAT domain-containing protein/tetratricopeptide (TPR) repeat protein
MNSTTFKIIAISSILVLSLQVEVSWSQAINENVKMAIPSPENYNSEDAYLLSEEGLKLYSQGFLKDALRFYEAELKIRKEIKDLSGEATCLDNIALIYRNLGDKQKAIDYYSKALLLSRATSNRLAEAYILNGIGALYDDLGEKQKALEYYKQSLPIMSGANDVRGEAKILSNIAAVYNSIGKRQKALEYYERALPIRRVAHDFQGESSTLRGIGLTYSDLGEKQKALEYQSQSLSISRSIKDRGGEAAALSNIAGIYVDLKNYQNAIEYFGKALLLMRALSDPRGEAYVLNEIGFLYNKLGEKQKALEYYNQSLPILRSVMDPNGEATTLNNIAGILDRLGDKPKALDYYNQALALMASTSDQSGEAAIFANIGLALSRDSQPELAIIFYKQSVNIIQSLRGDIKGLPKSTQQKYVQSVSESFRALADLLLKEDRVLEAEQMLDLLKVQELDEFLGDVRGNSITQKGVVILRPEQEILDRYKAHLKSPIQIGQEQKQLQNLSRSGKKLSPQQQQQLAQSDEIQTAVKGQFNQFINSPQIKQLSAQLARTGQEPIPLEIFDKLRANLSKLGNSALIYPLVLEDRLELIITTSDSPPLRRTVKVSRTQLNQAIFDYRDAMEDSTLALDFKTPALKLYRWLIQPLEADLTQAQIKTIIYAPDGSLRYIPLAALFDGKQWLAQRFATNTITAASLSDLNASQPSVLKILAGAFANEQLSYKVQVGQRTPLELRGLPSAGKEVNDLAELIPSTNKKIDQAFSLKLLKPSFGEYKVLHFATHAVFLPGTPEDSFILFGDGERATLRSIEDWSLPGVDLVVLSACDSGLGTNLSLQNPLSSKTKLGNGAELLGLGYQIQKAGARATIASLWEVSDGGTQSLMSAFYALLSKGNITKAEALRQAQVALITGKGKPQTGIKDLTHPHYWAPFFLIGNGL